jgi:hypothetical protein
MLIRNDSSDRFTTDHSRAGKRGPIPIDRDCGSRPSLSLWRDRRLRDLDAFGEGSVCTRETNHSNEGKQQQLHWWCSFIIWTKS